MSRIAGLFFPGPTETDDTLLLKMLHASSSAEWEKCYSILPDAAAGWTGWHSPRMTSSGNLLIVMDGFIYNWEDLGGESATDVSIVNDLFNQAGFEQTLQKINGDFSIAVYEKQTHTLWIGRDRFGMKPLYYTNCNGKFAFASRINALLCIPGVSKKLNHQFTALFAASHYRYFDNQMDKSPFEDISQVPAANYLRIGNDGTISCHQYWQLEDLPDFDEPEDILAERYKKLLFDAVAIRFKSAQKPVFTLSGGMDSSSVLASAVHYSHRKQHAISTVYEDKTFDESDDIQSMLESAVKVWHTVTIGTPNVFSIVQKIVKANDEPVATGTYLSHYLMCAKVADLGFSSLFGGLGGDELNAGEYEHFFYFFADLRATNMEERLGKEADMWIHYHNHPIFKKSREYMEQELNRLVDYTVKGKCLPDRKRIEKYKAALNQAFFDLASFNPVMDHPFKSYLKNRTYQDLTRETIPCCLRAEDRNTSAFSLDKFSPFFDYRLVEFMFRVPVTMKYHHGVTKSLLRKAMTGVLAEETRTRVKKTGWNAPGHVWFVGEGAEKLRAIVRSETFHGREIYNIPEVLKLIDEHEKIVLSGEVRENHMMFLWQLLNLETWLSHMEIKSPVL
jgi:asparagine synthase (glutamine-hydrolysing)